jgi:uncharacterized protein (TIGR02145 family)
LNSKYLLLDRDNLPNLHDHETALQRAKDAGKRLPTKEEFEALAALPHRWDDKRKGMCFRIPTRKPFEGWLRFLNPIVGFFFSRDVFFRAAGHRNYSSGSLYYVGTFGHYWSASPYGSTSNNASNLSFSSDYVDVDYYSTRSNGFSVRCVKDGV